MKRSQGALMLARVGATQEAIGARASMSRVRISLFQNGKRKPGQANRVVFKRLYGIPLGAWDLPALEPAPSGEIAPTPAEGPWTMSSRVERLQRIVDRTLEQIATDKNATPNELTRVGRQLGQMMNEIGKLTGETQEISIQRLLRLPAWRRMQETIVEALAPYPEAVRALSTALAEVAR